MNRHWALKLGDVCEIVSGATPKTGVTDYWGGDIPWATPADLSDLDGHYIDDTPRKITAAGLASCAARMLPANSVLLSSRAPIGHVAINTVPMATNQGFKSLIPKEGLTDAKYLFHWLRFNKTKIQSLGNGATFKEVSKAIVSEIGIDLPPLDEQRRIAAILDEADALRQKRKRAIALLDRLTQSIFLEMFGDPTSNSKSHDVLQVGELTNCIVPGRDKPKTFTGTIPWITTGEIVPLGTTHSHHAKAWLSDEEIGEVRARVIPQGSVIMSCVGDLGKTSLAGDRMVINQQLHAFQCMDRLTPEYLSHALSYQVDYMRRMATKTVLPYMNKSVCNSIPIQVPPMDHQRAFSDTVRALGRSRFENETAVGRLDSLFASLQHRAFSGQL